MRERKQIKYVFGDFTSPKGAVQQGAKASRCISKSEQLSHVRQLDHQVVSYGKSKS